MKSCPECSAKEERPVFKPYPEAFGTSNARAGEGGQSWCTECRQLAMRVS